MPRVPQPKPQNKSTRDNCHCQRAHSKNITSSLYNNSPQKSITVRYRRIRAAEYDQLQPGDHVYIMLREYDSRIKAYGDVVPLKVSVCSMYPYFALCDMGRYKESFHPMDIYIREGIVSR